MDTKNWLNNLRLGAKNDRALIIQGGEGSGKTTASRLVTKFMKAETAVREVSSGEFGDMFFLSRVYSAPLIVVNVIPGDYSVAFLVDHLKPLISNPQVRVDRQGKSTLTATNNMNFILLATGEFNLPEHQRRFIVASPFEVINAAIEVF